MLTRTAKERHNERQALHPRRMWKALRPCTSPTDSVGRAQVHTAAAPATRLRHRRSRSRVRVRYPHRLDKNEGNDALRYVRSRNRPIGFPLQRAHSQRNQVCAPQRAGGPTRPRDERVREPTPARSCPKHRRTDYVLEAQRHAHPCMALTL